MLISSVPERSAGFTLIELMIALVLGSLTLVAGLGLTTANLSLHSATLQRTRMNQDLRQISDSMRHDLQRAGAWSIAGALAQAGSTHDLSASALSGSISLRSQLAGTTTTDAAFAAPLSATTLVGLTLVISAREADGSTHRHELHIDAVPSTSSISATLTSGDSLPTTRIAAGSWTVLNPFTDLGAATGNCLVFSYDENGNGVRDAQELYGYRYNSSDHAVRAVNNADSCSDGSWENISDERSLKVTALSLAATTTSLSASSSLQAQRRYAGFTVNAQLLNVATADRVLRAGASVRNDALR